MYLRNIGIFMTFFFVSLKRKKSLNNRLTERGVFLLSLFIDFFSKSRTISIHNQSGATL